MRVYNVKYDDSIFLINKTFLISKYCWMAEHSKVAKTAAETLMDLLVGSKKKKFISATVLLIIAFLLQIRGKKSETETIKIKP